MGIQRAVRDTVRSWLKGAPEEKSARDVLGHGGRAEETSVQADTSWV